MTISIELSSLDSASVPAYPTDTPAPLNSSALCPDWPSVPQTTLIPSLYSIVCVLGTFGNALAVCVLAHGSGGRRTVANTFMLNLCVSDLLFLLSLPLWAVYYSLGYHWPFGRLACKLCGALLHLNLYASIFFITAMSVDRYLAIVHPLRSQSAREPWRAQLTCVLVWVLACACTAPILALRDTHHLREYDVEACVIVYPHQDWFLGLAWMKMLLGFLLPMAVISSCYCAIAIHLLGTPGLGAKRGSLEKPADRPPTSRAKPPEPQEAHSRSETHARPPTPSVNPSHSGGRASEGRGIDGRGLERVLWTVAAVVLAFFLCWFPFHCVTLLNVLQSQDWVAGCWVDWAVHNLTPLTLCLGFSNSAINPVLYCFLGNHFRGRLGVLWKGLCACVRARSKAHAQKRGSFSTRLSSFSRKLSDLKDLGAVEVPGPA
ncbi:type-2 angiotensin II receptor-like [Aplochiton taeniatus]